ncbi:MAG: hypothetical protein WC690_08920 [bacterium]
MRKFLLVVLLLAAVIYAFAQKYQIQTGHAKDGSFQMVMVDKAGGKLYHLVGGK